jgi:hypothetical protein
MSVNDLEMELMSTKLNIIYVLIKVELSQLVPWLVPGTNTLDRSSQYLILEQTCICLTGTYKISMSPTCISLFMRGIKLPF